MLPEEELYINFQVIITHRHIFFSTEINFYLHTEVNFHSCAKNLSFEGVIFYCKNQVLALHELKKWPK